VFVHGEVADSADRGARNAVDLVAQDVAQRVRPLVWAAAGAAAGGAPAADTGATVPPADSVVRDRGLHVPLRVVVRRGGGGVAWRVDRGALAAGGGDADGEAADTTGAALLGRALGASVAGGEFFVADDVIRGDSLVFELRLTRPTIEGPARAVRPVTARNPVAAFSLAVPWERTAAPVPGTIRLRYPESLQRAGYEGNARLRFVVGADGRVDARTVREVWPAGAARPAREERDAYEAFVAAARAAVAGARFHPARVAGCAVRQLVELPVAFTLNR
jgi:hypothetical protein